MRAFLPFLIACSSPQLAPLQLGTPLAISVGAQPVDVVAADLDGDGTLDLVTANGGDNTLSVRLHRQATWVAVPGPALVTDAAPHLVGVGDLDRDGDTDIIATAHDAGGVYAWLGDGRGAFERAPGSPFTAITAAKPHNHGLVVGDVDNDGDIDVVAFDQTARSAAVVLSDGAGALVPAASSPIALAGEPYPAVSGDMNADGHLDVVAPLLGGAIEVLLGDGRAGFAPARTPPFATAITRPYGLALGDLDRDGALDVVVIHDDTDRVSVLLGDGRGGLREAAGSPVSFGLRVWRPSLADIDGDGKLDLIAAGSGSLVVSRGDGAGGLLRPERVEHPGWFALARDLDGDGRVDIASPDPVANVLRVWLTPGR